MKPAGRAGKWLDKKAKRGVRGYPVGTIAFYGPDNRRATKVAASIIRAPELEPDELRRWFADSGDVRTSETLLAEIVSFFREHDVHSVAMAAGIIGCPHEEGVDYPEGETCPDCPYWAGRDRWTGKIEAN
ncbi:MAG TPA: hypothetical protein VII73_11265 [Caulobacteraceae bacterium]